ncbi:hypothetical protein M422DRAFT_263357 [Sphaerobolus stellatus SS14]|uniref:Unplaced genomic scaffold SPHSTscaffold_123, whole genome shotgun sequence n=1 Tax=Sphaerobolus stellatus (strain SS14) TaxID=990650 RepID=A0A0C9VB93_SPHS4|nr:hypothetical protein M422DRAFT_263357 [Sphaerobolus stellatus SS14]
MQEKCPELTEDEKDRQFGLKVLINVLPIFEAAGAEARTIDSETRPSPATPISPEPAERNVQVPANDRRQELLQEILDTLVDSESVSRRNKDPMGHFWTMYERTAKEYDEDFLEKYNTDLDSLLIFTGLFSAISSAFIMQMQSDLRANPTDTTMPFDDGFSTHSIARPSWAQAWAYLLGLVQRLK